MAASRFSASDAPVILLRYSSFDAFSSVICAASALVFSAFHGRKNTFRLLCFTVIIIEHSVSAPRCFPLFAFLRYIQAPLPPVSRLQQILLS